MPPHHLSPFPVFSNPILSSCHPVLFFPQTGCTGFTGCPLTTCLPFPSSPIPSCHPAILSSSSRRQDARDSQDAPSPPVSLSRLLQSHPVILPSCPLLPADRMHGIHRMIPHHLSPFPVLSNPILSSRHPVLFSPADRMHGIHRMIPHHLSPFPVLSNPILSSRHPVLFSPADRMHGIHRMIPHHLSPFPVFSNPILSSCHPVLFFPQTGCTGFTG